MMLANGLAAATAFPITMWLFGVKEVVPPLPFLRHLFGILPDWQAVWPLLPGMAVAGGCFWYWLVLTGRRNGVAWGGAVIYGALIALCNVPACGLILGTLQGHALLGMLLALLILLLAPSVLGATVGAGVVLGLLNGFAALLWIAKTKT